MDRGQKHLATVRLLRLSNFKHTLPTPSWDILPTLDCHEKRDEEDVMIGRIIIVSRPKKAGILLAKALSLIFAHSILFQKLQTL